jgi:hypothetical protein
MSEHLSEDEVLKIAEAMDTEREGEDEAPIREESGSGGILEFANPSGKGWNQKESKDEKPKRPRGRPPGSKSPRAKVKKLLGQQLVMIGMVASRFDEYDGKVIIANAEAMTEETMKVADESPWLMGILESMTTTSLYGGLILVYAGVAIPILANHGFIPEMLVNFFDAPPLPPVKENVTDLFEDEGRLT